jgi:acetyl-CoA carboxylase carboxyl transferase subunit beta
MIIDKLKKRENLYADSPVEVAKSNKKHSLAGKWVKCNRCQEVLYIEDLHNNFSVCPNCNNHFRLSARRRIKQIIDEETFVEFEFDETIKNPLNFPNYEKKIETLRKTTGIKEAVRAGIGKINGEKAVVAVMDANFMMASMGAYVRRSYNF